MIAIDLSKKQALDANPKAIQRVNFTANLDWMQIQQCFSLFKKRK